ncbi:MAG: DNA polymerase [Chloroflexota bacterium]
MSSWCDDCPFQGRTRVPFHGDRSRARLAVVGEAPHTHEVAEGRPFVGPAGHDFDATLRFLGIPRDELWIGNALLCGPIKESEKKGAAFRTALDCCRHRMIEEGDLDGFEVVLALGGFAFRSLTAEKVALMGKWGRRGTLHRDPRDKFTIVPTWHPSALRRAGGDAEGGSQAGGSKISDCEVETFAFDVRKAWLLATGRISRFDPEVEVTDDPDRFVAWIEAAGPAVAVDVETDSVDPTTCGLETVGLACGPLEPTEGDWSGVRAISFTWPARPSDAVLGALRGVLRGTTIYHNLQFDVTVLERLVGPVPGVVHDTLLGQHAAMPEVKLDLQSVAATYLPVHPWKVEFRWWEEKEGSRGSPEWWDRLRRYNALDAATTYAAWWAIRRECEERHVLHVEALDVRLAEVARKMTLAGIPISLENRAELGEEFARQEKAAASRLEGIVLAGVRGCLSTGERLDAVEELFRRIQKRANVGVPKPRRRKVKRGRGVAVGQTGLFGGPTVEEYEWHTPPIPEKAWRREGWNPRSNPQIKHAFDVCGVRIEKQGLTSTGQRSLGKQALVQVIDQPVVGALSDLRKYGRFMGAYFRSRKFKLSDAGRLHVSWKVHATPTGRWGSGGRGGGTGEIGIAVQNWPKRIRRMIAARPGWKLVGVDYAALEFRMIALLAGEERLLEIFNNLLVKRDLHSENAARLYVRQWQSCDPALARDEEQLAERERRRYLIRQFTKTGIYAAIYKAVAKTIQSQLRAASLKEDDDEFAAMLRNVGLRDCRLFVDAIPRFWPDIARFQDRMIREIQESGEWVCPFGGRRRTWPMGRADAAQCVNTPVQGSSATLMNDRFLALVDVLPPEVEIILQVHDSVMLHAPAEIAGEVRDLAVRIMTTDLEYQGHRCHFAVEADVGDTGDKA